MNYTKQWVDELTCAMGSAMNLMQAVQYLNMIPKLPGVKFTTEMEECIQAVRESIANSACSKKTAKILEQYRSNFPAAGDFADQMYIWLPSSKPETEQ